MKTTTSDKRVVLSGGPGDADVPPTEILVRETVASPPLKARETLMSPQRATAELLAALVKLAIAHGRRHYSESGEPLATALAVLECLQREGFVTVEAPGT
jgi:hypothetical protein